MNLPQRMYTDAESKRMLEFLSGGNGKFSGTPTTLLAIEQYFNSISYPRMVSCRLVYSGGALGGVYLVGFDPDEVSLGGNFSYMKSKSQRSPCYAIEVDGVVSGYPEDFWSDADKYRLVLKQHLGMLQMEAHEKRNDTPPAVSEPEKEAPRTVNPDTIEAIVGRYECLVDTLTNELADLEESFEKERVSCENQLQNALKKLDLVKRALNGQIIEPVDQPERVVTPEEQMIIDDQGDEDVTAIADTSLSAYGQDVPNKPYPISINEVDPLRHPNDQRIRSGQYPLD